MTAVLVIAQPDSVVANPVVILGVAILLAIEHRQIVVVLHLVVLVVLLTILFFVIMR